MGLLFFFFSFIVPLLRVKGKCWNANKCLTITRSFNIYLHDIYIFRGIQHGTEEKQPKARARFQNLCVPFWFHPRRVTFINFNHLTDSQPCQISVQLIHTLSSTLDSQLRTKKKSLELTELFSDSISPHSPSRSPVFPHTFWSCGASIIPAPAIQ